MKTKLFLLCLLVGFSVSIFAQESQVYESRTPAYKTSFKRNNAGDNLSILPSIDRLYAVFQEVSFSTVELIGKYIKSDPLEFICSN